MISQRFCVYHHDDHHHHNDDNHDYDGGYILLCWNRTRFAREREKKMQIQIILMIFVSYDSLFYSTVKCANEEPMNHNVCLFVI